MRIIEDLGMIYPQEGSSQKRHYAIYECPFCGSYFRAQVYKIQKKATISCGCRAGWRGMGERSTTHGLSQTRIYAIWNTMNYRCYNIKSTGYKKYGAKGISVCENWRNSCVEFYEWAITHGYGEGLQIDRIDGTGDYCPENCRWVSPVMNAQNTKMREANTSGYIGVNRRHNKWAARITNAGIRIWLGCFETAVEAAKAYNNYVIENKTYHTLNIIKDE